MELYAGHVNGALQVAIAFEWDRWPSAFKFAVPYPLPPESTSRAAMHLPKKGST